MAKGVQTGTGALDMNLERLADRVANEVSTALSDLPESERSAILDIVRQAMLDSATRTHREMKDTAVICCGPWSEANGRACGIGADDATVGSAER